MRLKRLIVWAVFWALSALVVWSAMMMTRWPERIVIQPTPNDLEETWNVP